MPGSADFHRMETGFGVVEFGLDRCYDGPVPTSGNQRRHRDPVWCAWIIRGGKVLVCHAGGRLEAGPGALMLMPHGLLRDQQFSSGARIASLRLRLRRSDGAPTFRYAPPLVLAAPEGLDAAIRALAACLATSPVEGTMEATAQRLAAFGAALAQWWRTCLGAGWLPTERAALDPRLGVVLALLEAHGRIAPAPWGSLESASGLSRRQLDRLFQSQLGCSPATWLNERCGERATTLLAQPGLPIKAVAERCGFADTSHFVRWFRRHHGATPGQRRLGV